MRRIDLTGQKFEKLLVLRLDPEPVVWKSKTGYKRARLKWLCRCDCGAEVSVFGSNLKKGNSTSCGCKHLNSKKYNAVDLLGQTFGSLKVIEKSPELTKTRGAIWMCQCSCGRTVEVPTNGLTSGNNRTCGNQDAHYRSPRVGDIPINHVNGIRQNATKRNLLFSVTPEYLWKLFLEQDKKCVLSGVPLVFTDRRNAWKGRHETTASLDRIDSDKGYIEGNVRWVHKDVNIMRSDMTDAEFLEWCSRCVAHTGVELSLFMRESK